jgi:hypothetical protein
MASFSTEYEQRWARRASELGRDLTTEEANEVEGLLFQPWIDGGRIDDLIRRHHANHGRSGGLTDLIVLGHHLRQTRDETRIDALFGGLLARRVKAFHQWWPKASSGHVASMREAARAAAEAMDVYVEYFISLDSLGLDAERDALRAEMQRFQDRLPATQVLPKLR